MKKIISVNQLVIGVNASEIMEFFKAEYYTTPPMRAITGIRLPDGSICKYNDWILQYEDDSYSVVSNETFQAMLNLKGQSPVVSGGYSLEDIMQAIKYGENRKLMDNGAIPYVTLEQFLASLPAVKFRSREDFKPYAIDFLKEMSDEAYKHISDAALDQELFVSWLAEFAEGLCLPVPAAGEHNNSQVNVHPIFKDILKSFMP